LHGNKTPIARFAIGEILAEKSQTPIKQMVTPREALPAGVAQFQLVASRPTRLFWLFIDGQQD
jgi:hypothetical protein